MRPDSPSPRSAEFDEFRRELLLGSKPVAGEEREAWFERLKALCEALFPDSQRLERKPGLASRLFSIEVSLPDKDKFLLLDLANELDDNWRAETKPLVKAGSSCTYLDRLDAIWEWVVDLGDRFVTGHVKLRNYGLEPRSHERPKTGYRPAAPGRPSGGGGFNRGPRRDFGPPNKGGRFQKPGSRPPRRHSGD
ncbi:MAG: hypothetical protein KIT11_10150 [Fimbriimonadaceae bacterium]|nr:hypothetical protein [Fimbriimonadaceae bacterium]QYK55684.1 MAG: hypothetical protein KF733_11820 [Fimbriimonadaceae bacterium]